VTTGAKTMRRVIPLVALAGVGVLFAFATSGTNFTSSSSDGSNTFTTGSLTAPDPLTCAWTGANALSLTWTANAAADGYTYERSNSLATGYTVLGTTSGAASVTGSDSNPAPPTVRYYRVEATAGSSWTGAYSAPSASNSCDGTITTVYTALAGDAPSAVAVDASGNVYTTLEGADEVIKITPGGSSSVFAGTGTGGFSGDGGPATSAKLNSPRGIGIDSSGNVYIADTGNNRIRKVTVAGIISTVAGTGTAGFSGDGGAATAAKLSGPYGVSVDASGTIYIADTGNHRVRNISSGTITTIAGTGTSGFTGDGGTATSAQLASPHDAIADTSGNVYIADTGNNRVRKITSGTISTIAGGGASSACTFAGTATSASLSSPGRLAYDSTGGRLFIPDAGRNCVRVLTGTTISDTAGTGTAGYSGDNGPAIGATVTSPTGAGLSSTGDLYVADNSNDAVRKIIRP
jgi:NHL repeat